MLSEALSDDFNMEAQDGSPEEVSGASVGPSTPSQPIRAPSQRSLVRLWRLRNNLQRQARRLIVAWFAVLQVSKVLVELYQQCARDDYSSVFRWRADADRAGAGARASRQQVVSPCTLQHIYVTQHMLPLARCPVRRELASQQDTARTEHTRRRAQLIHRSYNPSDRALLCRRSFITGVDRRGRFADNTKTPYGVSCVFSDSNSSTYKQTQT